MKIAVFSDLHIHTWSEFSVDDRGVPSRLRHGISVLKKVRKHCVENGIKLVLFGGDLFHKRGVLYTHPYNLVCEELALWKEAKLTLCANAGNHDAADRHAKVHALQAMESAGLLLTVGECGWANWEIDDEVNITAVAYCADASELRRRTDEAIEDRGDCRIATVGLFHHGFRGARVGTSLEYVVKEDADPNLYVKEFGNLLSGHYHAHQEIGADDHSWYVGSPMEFVRGETSPKGFVVLDTEKRSIRRHNLGLPRFVKLDEEQMRDNDFDVEEHINGNYVDVIFEELPVPWEKLEKTLLKKGALGARACPTAPEKLAKSSRLQVDPTMGDRQLLESYLEHVQADPSERDELLRVGLALLEGATK